MGPAGDVRVYIALIGLIASIGALGGDSRRIATKRCKGLNHPRLRSNACNPSSVRLLYSATRARLTGRLPSSASLASVIRHSHSIQRREPPLGFHQASAPPGSRRHKTHFAVSLSTCLMSWRRAML